MVCDGKSRKLCSLMQKRKSSPSGKPVNTIMRFPFEGISLSTIERPNACKFFKPILFVNLILVFTISIVENRVTMHCSNIEASRTVLTFRDPDFINHPYRLSQLPTEYGEFKDCCMSASSFKLLKTCSFVTPSLKMLNEAYDQVDFLLFRG